MATIAALLAIASLAVAGTWAAWTATDTNPGNTFSTSTITINDNQGGSAGGSRATPLNGTAMFNVTNLSPGSTATTACIGVNFTGTASSLSLAATLGGAGQSTLQSQLTVTGTYNTSGTVTVTDGTNTNLSSCTGYPAGGTNVAIGTAASTLAAWSAAGPYAIASPVTSTWYKFVVSGLPAGDTDCSVYCNKTITVSLAWTLTTA